MLRRLLALSLLAGACAAPIVRNSEDGLRPARASNLIVVPTRINPDTVGLGNCEVRGNSVDLRRMIVHENRWLDAIGEHGRIRVRISGESVAFERLEGDRSITSFNVGAILSDESDIDVELRLALVENQLSVYWRETFQNRIYRQGLFRIVGEELQRWCEGRGGVQSDPSIIDRTTLE